MLGLAVVGFGQVDGASIKNNFCGIRMNANMSAAGAGERRRDGGSSSWHRHEHQVGGKVEQKWQRGPHQGEGWIKREVIEGYVRVDARRSRQDAAVITTAAELL